jgi:hypothetical protein
VAAALDNPLFVLTKHPLHVFSKLLFEEKITLPEFESICNRLLLSPVHILTRILEPPYNVKSKDIVRKLVSWVCVIAGRHSWSLLCPIKGIVLLFHLQCTSATTFCKIWFLYCNPSMGVLAFKTSIWQVAK